MKIVEYNPKYAASIADMWNKSNSSWGNDDEYKTEEEVIDFEKNSGNIKTYLAIEKDEVIGLCSFSEYKQDEGASYLPILNVRPDYHGKKIGKKLILKVLDDAIKSKWQRFDLYTWSGNIKAMPLYKKCGFFWERRNNSVHLMNFIPYVHQTQALETYTKQLDLYKDSQRDINLDFDGVETNGFDIYYYDFKNQSTYLSLGFEKTGRGLVYINNPDYEIRLSVPKHKLVHSQEYEAILSVVNKSSKNIDIDIHGKENKNINVKFKQSYTVKDTEKILIPFYVGENLSVQDFAKTHSCVDINLLIDGKKANLKCGILTKNPIEISLNTTELIHSKDVIYKAYLNLENNLDRDEIFKINLPSTKISFEKEINITLKQNEKRSVCIPYTINEFGYYCEEALVRYRDKLYKKEVKSIFKGTKEEFVCDLDKQILVVSGNSVMTYQKDSHNIHYSNTYNQVSNIGFMAPNIGLPYSLEFNNKEPKIQIISDHQITLSYESSSFKGVYLNIHTKNTNGLLEVVYELVNKGEEKELSLSIPIVKSMSHSYIPYQSRILKIDEYGGYIGNINASKVDENWIYNDKLKQGFMWPKHIKFKISSWHMSFDVESINLKHNESFKTEPFIVSYVHPSLKDFQKFVNSKDDKMIFAYMEMNINGFNPFIKGQVEAQLLNHRKAQVNGSITNNQIKYDLSEKFLVGEGLQKFEIELADRIFEENRYLFKVHGKVSMSEKEGVYTVDNGLLSYKADINHSDSVFSLIFNQHEWLDSNYPQPKERAWWASFIGGLTQRISGIQDVFAIQEDREIECVEIKDNFDNQWYGLKVTTHYQSDPIFKGVSTENYILTMPGIPLIHTFTNVINKSGALLLDKLMHRRYTLNPDKNRDKIRFIDKFIIYKIPDQANEVKIDKMLSIESSRDHQLVIYGGYNEMLFDTQKEYMMLFSEKKMTVPDLENRIFEGEFLFFTKEKLKKEDLSLFDYIKFDL